MEHAQTIYNYLSANNVRRTQGIQPQLYLFYGFLYRRTLFVPFSWMTIPLWKLLLLANTLKPPITVGLDP